MGTEINKSVTGGKYEAVEDGYFSERELRKGAAGWILLAGLGVAYVISGDFAGWNFGLAEGGWGGLAIATLLMAVMNTTMIFSLAELSATIPSAGGGAANLANAGNPLIAAMRSETAYRGPTLTGKIINIVGLAGLIASFFSIIFGYSRQVFALSRAGYLPRVLSLTSKRKTPYLALLVPGSLVFCFH